MFMFQEAVVGDLIPTNVRFKNQPQITQCTIELIWIVVELLRRANLN